MICEKKKSVKRFCLGLGKDIGKVEKIILRETNNAGQQKLDPPPAISMWMSFSTCFSGAESKKGIRFLCLGLRFLKFAFQIFKKDACRTVWFYPLMQVDTFVDSSSNLTIFCTSL